MKHIIIFNNGEPQIDLVPENDADNVVLELLKEGSVFKVGKSSGYAKCSGGYLRRYDKGEGVKFTYFKQEKSDG